MITAERKNRYAHSVHNSSQFFEFSFSFFLDFFNFVGHFLEFFIFYLCCLSLIVFTIPMFSQLLCSPWCLRREPRRSWTIFSKPARQISFFSLSAIQECNFIFSYFQLFLVAIIEVSSPSAPYFRTYFLIFLFFVLRIP